MSKDLAKELEIELADDEVLSEEALSELSNGKGDDEDDE